MFDDTIAGKHAVQSFPATQVIDDAKKEQAAGIPEIRTISVIWLVVWNMAFMTFPAYWECHHPNWRTPSFFRGVGLSHQPSFIIQDEWRMITIHGESRASHAIQSAHNFAEIFNWRIIWCGYCHPTKHVFWIFSNQSLPQDNISQWTLTQPQPI